MQPLDRDELTKALDRFESHGRHAAPGEPSPVPVFPFDAAPTRMEASREPAPRDKIRRYAIPGAVAAVFLTASAYIAGVLPWPDSTPADRTAHSPKTLTLAPEPEPALPPTETAAEPNAAPILAPIPAPNLAPPAAETPLEPPRPAQALDAPAPLPAGLTPAAPAPAALAPTALAPAAHTPAAEAPPTAVAPAAPEPAAGEAPPPAQKVKKAHKAAPPAQKRAAHAAKPPETPKRDAGRSTDKPAGKPAAGPTAAAREEAPRPAAQPPAAGEPGYLERAQRAIRGIPDTVKGFVGM